MSQLFLLGKDRLTLARFTSILLVCFNIYNASLADICLYLYLITQLSSTYLLPTLMCMLVCFWW